MYVTIFRQHPAALFAVRGAESRWQVLGNLCEYVAERSLLNNQSFLWYLCRVIREADSLGGLETIVLDTYNMQRHRNFGTVFPRVIDLVKGAYGGIFTFCSLQQKWDSDKADNDDLFFRRALSCLRWYQNFF